MGTREQGSEAYGRFGLSRFLQDTLDVSEGSAGDMLQRLLRASRLYLGMDIAFISRFEDGDRVFRYVDQAEGHDLLKVGCGDPLEESYCQRVVDGRLPELIEDAQTLEEAQELPATGELGVRAHVSTPIRLSDGSIFGTFCCFSFQSDHSLNARDREILHTFAEVAAGIIQPDVERAKEEAASRSRIENLLEADQLNMVWQPIMDLENERMVGVETLARFPKGPHNGPPGWFQEAADVGLAEALETTAVRKGLEALPDLPADQYIACNATAAAVLDGGLVDLLEQMPLERIVLEITEHDVVEDYEALEAALAPLRKKGLRLAVDDAGAGYASFRHILSLRPDIIKLDMSLTRDIDSDIGRRSLAAALVSFCEEIGSKLVAEGVETVEERNALRELGVGRAQGYYLYRPKPREELRSIIEMEQ